MRLLLLVTWLFGCAEAPFAGVAWSHEFFPLVRTLHDDAGLAQPSEIAVSPDGRHVYVGAWRENTISVFDRDVTTGALTLSGSVHQDDPPLSPHEMVVSPDGTRLYSYGATRTVFARDAATGALTSLQSASGGLGDSVFGLAVSPDGTSLFVFGSSCCSSYQLRVFAVGPTGLTLVQTHSGLAGNVTALLLAGDVVAVAPNSLDVYVATRLGVARFRRTAPPDVAVTFVDTTSPGGSDDARDLAISPDGAHVYTTVRNGLLATYARDPDTGALTLVERMEREATGLPLDETAAIRVSPDGAQVYVTVDTFFGERAIHVFARNPSTGRLTLVDPMTVERPPDDLVLSNDGANVYTVGRAVDAIDVWARAGATGALAPVETEWEGPASGSDGLGGATGIAITGDGSNIYISAAEDQSVAVFGRNPVTGFATFQELLRDGDGGVDGIHGAQGVAVSPDDRHVYVAGHDEDAVAVFARDAATGALTPASIVRDGLGGVSGIDGATSVAVTPDGAHVVVVADVEDGVTVFARDVATGALTFVEHDQAPGLIEPKALRITPDGAHLLVGSRPSGALAVFARDAGTGHLTFVEQRTDAERDVEGLENVETIDVSDDGRIVYAGGTVFERDPASGRLTHAQRLFVSGPATLRTIDPTLLYTFPTQVVGPRSGDIVALLRGGSAPQPRSVHSPDGRFFYGLSVPTELEDSALVQTALGPCAPMLPGTQMIVMRTDQNDENGAGFQLTASWWLRDVPFPTLDPTANGLRLFADAAEPLDVTLPPGLYAGKASRGWRSNGAGTTFVYRDTTDAPLNGIKKAQVKRGSVPGTVSVKVQATRGTYPLASSGENDVRVYLGPGLASCGAHGAFCQPNVPQHTLRCTTR